MRIHSERCAIDNHLVFADDFGRNILIEKRPVATRPTDERRFESERTQTVVDGFRSAARTQNQGFFVARLQQRFDALREANDIAIKALQMDVFAFSTNANHVHRTDGTSLGTHRVEIGNHLLLVRNRDVESAQFGVLVEHLAKIVNRGNLEIDVASVDVLVFKLLVEVTDRERMAERVADESVFVHFFLLFSRHIVCADAECHSLESGLRKTSFFQNFNHFFALRKGFDGRREIFVGTLVLGNQIAIDGQNRVGIEAEELFHREFRRCGQFDNAQVTAFFQYAIHFAESFFEFGEIADAEGRRDRVERVVGVG